MLTLDSIKHEGSYTVNKYTDRKCRVCGEPFLGPFSETVCWSCYDEEQINLRDGLYNGR